MAVLANENSHLLLITNVVIEVHCFTNTDAEISVLLMNTNDRLQDPVFSLQMASEKPIASCGKGYVYRKVDL